MTTSTASKLTKAATTAKVIPTLKMGVDAVAGKVSEEIKPVLTFLPKRVINNRNSNKKIKSKNKQQKLKRLLQEQEKDMHDSISTATKGGQGG